MTEDEMLSKYPQTRGTPIARHLAVALLAIVSLLPLAGCGGQGGDGGTTTTTTGSLAMQVRWQQHEASTNANDASVAEDASASGFGNPIPPSVQTIQIVIDSGEAGSCCIAVTPGQVPPDASTQRTLELTNIPLGAASVRVRGFPTTLAPAPASAVRCQSTSSIGRDCNPPGSVSTLASFVSPEVETTIAAGASGEVTMEALPVPFVLDDALAPAPGATVQSPVFLELAIVTAVDSVSNINPEDITLELAGENVALDSTATRLCDDRTSETCSTGGTLGVRGLHIRSLPQPLPRGPTSASVRVDNDATRRVGFSAELSYAFTVGGIPLCGNGVIDPGEICDNSANPSGCNQGPEQPETCSGQCLLCVGTGQVRVTLEWDTTIDIDLHVVEPSGEEIYFGHTFSATGGKLDSDRICNTNPVPENIFWLNHAPQGEYRVSVVLYGTCSEAGATSTTYTVTVVVDTRQQTYPPKTITEVGEEQPVVTFTVP